MIIIKLNIIKLIDLSIARKNILLKMKIIQKKRPKFINFGLFLLITLKVQGRGQTA